MPYVRSVLIALCLSLIVSPAETVGKTADELVLRPLPGFSELSQGSDQLFRDTEKKAIAHGKLLKMYLPQYMAHQYRYGGKSLVTRQVVINALETAPECELTVKDVELLARSLEGMFKDFCRVPHGRMDTPAQEIEHRQSTLRQSLATGTPFLSEVIRHQSAWFYIYLIHYNMDSKEKGSFLSMAMANAVIHIKGTALLVTVSSILEGNDASTELEWVKDTAMNFTSVILSDNAGAQ